MKEQPKAKSQFIQEPAELRPPAEYAYDSDVIIESFPGWFYVLDSQRRFVRWNHVIEETTGVSPENLRGMDCLLTIFEDDRGLVAGKIREVFDHGQAEVQARAIAKNGVRHFLFTGRRMNVGPDRYLVGCGVDVTERHRMETRVARLNQRKEQFLGPGGIREKLALLTDGVVEVLGADFARIWVVKEGDLCEKGCLHATVTEGPDVCRDRTHCLHLMASSGRYSRVDGSHRRVPLGCYKIGRVASGEDAGFVTNDVTHDFRVHDHRWAEDLGLVAFAGYRLLSPEGKPLGVLAMFSRQAIDAGDETLLEDLANTASQAIRAGLAEESLRQSEEIARRQMEEIEAIYNSAPIGLCVFDTELRYVHINERLAELNGVPAARHIGRTTRDVVPSLADWTEAMLRQVIETGQPVLNVECTGTTPARPGVLRTWIVHWWPLKHALERVTGVNVVVEEITERKRAEKALRDAHDELEQRVRDRTSELTRTVEQLRKEVEERTRAEMALQQERRTLEHLLRSSDHERQVIAYEIHDGLAQQLAGAIMQFQAYPQLKDRKPEQAAKAYDAGMTMLQQGHFEARRLISGVRPPILDELGIATAIAHLVQEQQLQEGPKIELLSSIEFDRLDSILENAIYRIIQEGLANACQHSRSEKVRVEMVQSGDRLRIEIRDWGIGFAPDAVRGGCFGLEGIRQRARLLGGSVVTDAARGKGARIVVELPLVPKERPA